MNYPIITSYTKRLWRYICENGLLRRKAVCPSFLIIGAQRAGTTSLYSYLVEHPLIVPAARKEVHFFDHRRHWGAKWYFDQFRGGMRSGAITGEASPYYLYHPLVPSRVHALMPNIKLLILLRNPIDRALSHYHHEVRRGFETLRFADALKAEEPRLEGEVVRMERDPRYRSTNHQRFSYKSRGHYLEQLELWLNLFPKENIMILFSERFYEAPGRYLDKIARFLHLPAFPKRHKPFPIHNRATYSKMAPSLRDELRAYFRPHNERLASFLGADPGWD